MDVAARIANSQLLAGIAVGFFILMLLLLAVIWVQRRQLSQLEQRQRSTGFLGKPLMSIAMMALVVGGFAATAIISRQVMQNDQSSVSVNADEDVTFRILTRKSTLQDGNVQVVFEFLPTVAGLEWGGERSGLEYDVFWTFRGPEAFSKIELGLSSTKKGGITRILPPGKYQINLEIFQGEGNWVHSEEISV